MRKYLCIIAILVFVPCAKADTYVVASGVISLLFGNVMLSGVAPSGGAFTATGTIIIFPCQTHFAPGEAISPCGHDAALGEDLYSGGLSITVDGKVQQIALGPGDDFPFEFNSAPLHLSGATQATLTEPVGVSFFGCYPVICVTGPVPGQVDVFFPIPGPEYLTTSLVLSADGGYDVTSEVVTITAPEPSSDVLLLAGVGLFGLVTRKRIAHGRQQAN